MSDKNKLTQQALRNEEIKELNERFEGHHADKVLRWAWNRFAEKAVLGTGFGPSGLFLMHRIKQLELGIPVFYLDTRLLFSQTYHLAEELKKKLGIEIFAIAPELTLEGQAKTYGDELWKRNPDQCCHLRKVLPLQKHLADKAAWITGVRRHQSSTRTQTPVVTYEPSHDVIKLNPMAAYSSDEIWDYIHEQGLPYNPMHDEGYPSIGCIPCTSPVQEGEDERSGRWRGEQKVECGIHISADGKVERSPGS